MPGVRRHPTSAEQASVALGNHLARSLQAVWRGYRKKLKRCQKHFSEESVHDLRVETRRLLSLLDLLGTLDAHDYLRKARRILKKRLDLFDDLRDTQVQLLHLKTAQRDFPEMKPLRKALQRHERRLIRTARREVRGFRTARLKRHLAALDSALRASFANSATAVRNTLHLAQIVQRAFDRVLTLRGRIDPTQTTTIHRTRIAFKKYRYMVECLHPVLSGVRADHLRAMHDYQNRMGDIQDLEVFLARLTKLVAKRKIKGKPLQPFRLELIHRRAASIQAYLKSADELLRFRPTPVQAAG